MRKDVQDHVDTSQLSSRYWFTGTNVLEIEDSTALVWAMMSRHLRIFVLHAAFGKIPKPIRGCGVTSFPVNLKIVLLSAAFWSFCRTVPMCWKCRNSLHSSMYHLYTYLLLDALRLLTTWRRCKPLGIAQCSIRSFQVLHAGRAWVHMLAQTLAHSVWKLRKQTVERRFPSLVF